MNEPCNRISELGFVIPDAVAAHDGAICLHHFGESACENSFENFEITFLWKADKSERSERASTHGVDVAKRIGGGDLTEDVRIVNYGREEVDSLHQRGCGPDLIHASIVGVVEPTRAFGSCCRANFPST